MLTSRGKKDRNCNFTHKLKRSCANKITRFEVDAIKGETQRRVLKQMEKS